jgi:hypothetical protein
MHDRNFVFFRVSVNRLHVSVADLAEGSRRRDSVLPPPAQEDAHLPDGLKFRYIRLQEDAVDGAALKGDVVPQQGRLVGHDNLRFQQPEC